MLKERKKCNLCPYNQGLRLLTGQICCAWCRRGPAPDTAWCWCPGSPSWSCRWSQTPHHPSPPPSRTCNIGLLRKRFKDKKELCQPVLWIQIHGIWIRIHNFGPICIPIRIQGYVINFDRKKLKISLEKGNFLFKNIYFKLLWNNDIRRNF